MLSIIWSIKIVSIFVLYNFGVGGVIIEVRSLFNLEFNLRVIRWLYVFDVIF